MYMTKLFYSASLVPTDGNFMSLFVKKGGKDTWQSILGYLAKYPNILFYGSYMLEKLNQDFYACGVGFTRKMNINPQLV